MRWKFVKWLTVKATDMCNFLLRKRNWKHSLADYRNMPTDSLGNNLADYMEKNNIRFKQNLDRHDLKHIVLGYEMNMPDELRIHSFLLGNRCYNLMSMAYLFICVAVVPEIIPTLRKDFKRGRKAKKMREINLENYLESDLKECQKLWDLLL